MYTILYFALIIIIMVTFTKMKKSKWYYKVLAAIVFAFLLGAINLIK